MGNGTGEPLIEVTNLKKHFPIHKGIFGRLAGQVKAVDGISFSIRPNETLGLVGESGCGKTTAGRALLRLIEPTAGTAMYGGKDLFKLNDAEMRVMRRNLQIIFQDPYSSLNPRMTVENLIGEAVLFHGLAKQSEIRGQVQELLERVGLQAQYVSRYPHEFSGGQRQRIGIARALALKPKFIVCDEAVSALDVSVQAQVINLLQDLQDEFNLSYLFIAHDLSVVRHISDRVAVMYLGRLAEIADCDDIFAHPAHPYTQALLSAIPVPDPRSRAERIILKGDVPTPINPPSGCRFHTRCPAAMPQCRKEIPELTEVAAGHYVACHLYTDPSRAGQTMSRAQAEVASLVRAGATISVNKKDRGFAQRTAIDDAVAADDFVGSAVQSVVDSAAKAARDGEARASREISAVGMQAPPEATEPEPDAKQGDPATSKDSSNES